MLSVVLCFVLFYLFCLPPPVNFPCQILYRQRVLVQMFTRWYIISSLYQHPQLYLEDQLIPMFVIGLSFEKLKTLFDDRPFSESDNFHENHSF